jgi:hypothetical protein
MEIFPEKMLGITKKQCTFAPAFEGRSILSSEG